MQTIAVFKDTVFGDELFNDSLRFMTEEGSTVGMQHSWKAATTTTTTTTIHENGLKDNGDDDGVAVHNVTVNLEERLLDRMTAMDASHETSFIPMQMMELRPHLNDLLSMPRWASRKKELKHDWKLLSEVPWRGRLRDTSRPIQTFHTIRPSVGIYAQTSHIPLFQRYILETSRLDDNGEPTIDERFFQKRVQTGLGTIDASTSTQTKRILLPWTVIITPNGLAAEWARQFPEVVNRTKFIQVTRTLLKSWEGKTVYEILDSSMIVGEYAIILVPRRYLNKFKSTVMNFLYAGFILSRMVVVLPELLTNIAEMPVIMSRTNFTWMVLSNPCYFFRSTMWMKDAPWLEIFDKPYIVNRFLFYSTCVLRDAPSCSRGGTVPLYVATVYPQVDCPILMRSAILPVRMQCCAQILDQTVLTNYGSKHHKCPFCRRPLQDTAAVPLEKVPNENFDGVLRQTLVLGKVCCLLLNDVPFQHPNFVLVKANIDEFLKRRHEWVGVYFAPWSKRNWRSWIVELCPNLQATFIHAIDDQNDESSGL